MKMADRLENYFSLLRKITVLLSNGRIVRGHILQLHDDFLTVHDKTFGPIDIPFPSIVAVAPVRDTRKRSAARTGRSIKNAPRGR
ncbi:hypothetical protein [Paenibacillus glycinis]|uniref:LSM domain-containing protein n=1 Tax=Paenibacillus glycinis TaxID=2697035 RepID=A0ABW9XQ65_9BACL|nr:hypothetical protein [Paenibacillus glycinis]NBD24780.1 hypothetical protein [Paenibacillus glycinis]